MHATPVPPMTPEMLKKYWASACGIKQGHRYRVNWRDERVNPSRGAFTGIFQGITKEGDMCFRQGNVEVVIEGSVNTTMRRL